MQMLKNAFVLFSRSNRLKFIDVRRFSLHDNIISLFATNYTQYQNSCGQTAYRRYLEIPILILGKCKKMNVKRDLPMRAKGDVAVQR